MEQVTSPLQQASLAAADSLAALIAYVPNVLGAVLLVLAGWLMARIARAAAGRLGDGANRVLGRLLRSGSLARVRLSPRALKLAGDLVFWLIILFFVTAATKVARLDAFSAWLDQIVAYLPTLLAGGLIILAGYLLSTLMRDLVSATLASARIGQSDLFGAAAQGATILTGLIIGIAQIGIDVTFLATIVAIGLAALFGGVSLAFGLGAKTLVSNLIGAHYLRQQFQPGQTARIGDVEGEILELTPTSVVLATIEGRMTIPAKVFNEQSTVLVTPASDD